MKILDRLYDDFKVYDEDLELSSWTPFWLEKDFSYVELLSDREGYEYLFENFGNHKISEGLNCSTLHKLSTYEKFDFCMKELKKIFYENSKHLDPSELLIDNICELQGENFSGKIIPPAFYKYGLNLNTILDLYSNTKKPKSILEIGAGYGGFTYLTLNKFKETKYVILDILPSIYISAYFLYKLGKKIILPNEFISFDQFMKSDNQILFIKPSQLKDIPDSSIDLSINMDSFIEMKELSIVYYLTHINRITNDYFYSNNLSPIPGNSMYNFYIKKCKRLLENFKHNTQDSIFMESTKENEELVFNLVMDKRYVEDVYERRLG